VARLATLAGELEAAAAEFRVVRWWPQGEAGLKLVYLHGPPAAGKYSIALGLQEEAGLLNFHSHLTLDVAKSLFDFGTPAFWDLTNELRQVSLRAIAQDPDAAVVFTSCYSHPHDHAGVLAIERVAVESGGEFLPVFLECGVDELRRRVGNPARVAMKKLTSVTALDEFLETWNIVPLDHARCVTIRTEGRRSADCVDEVIERLGLNK